MKQSHMASITEATVNVLIGYWVAVATSAFILPKFGFHTTTSDNLLISLVFTVVSLARTYILRRIFEHFREFKRIGYGKAT